MAGIRVELANPKLFKTPEEYVERHLTPIAAELHRLANEFFVPGSTSEELAVDMTTQASANECFRRLDRPLDPSPKHVIFDGSEYFLLPKNLLRQSQVKVQFTASCYVKGGGAADFRLTSSRGFIIKDSIFTIYGSEVQKISLILPFGDQIGCITPDSQTYFIEARCLATGSLPVCRRFSLAFVYL